MSKCELIMIPSTASALSLCYAPCWSQKSQISQYSVLRSKIFLLDRKVRRADNMYFSASVIQNSQKPPVLGSAVVPGVNSIPPAPTQNNPETLPGWIFVVTWHQTPVHKVSINDSCLLFFFIWVSQIQSKWSYKNLVNTKANSFK